MTTRQKAAPLSGDLLARRKVEQRSGLVLSDGGQTEPDLVALARPAERSVEPARHKPDSRFDDITRQLGDSGSGPDWRSPFRAVLLFAIPLAAFLTVFWYVYNQTTDTTNDTAATTAQQPAPLAASTSSALTLPAPAAGPIAGEQSAPPIGIGASQVAAAPPPPGAPPKAVVPPPTPPAATSEAKLPTTSSPATKPPVMPPVPTRDKPAAPIKTARAPTASAGADKAAPKPSGRYTIQLSSVRTAKTARREWARLQQAFPGLLKDLDLDIREVTLRQRGTYHRVRAGAFEDRAAPRALCAKLKARKQDCLVVRR